MPKKKIAPGYYLIKYGIWLSYKLFERWNEEINEEKIIAVNAATYAVAKRKPEKFLASSARIQTLTSVIPGQRFA